MKKFILYLRSIVRLRRLITTLIYREVSVRYRQSLLGITWAVIRPISLTMVLYFSFFSVGSSIETANQNPFIFILSGLLTFELFIAVINNCTRAVISNRQLVEKINLPKLIFPLAIGLSSLIDYMIGFTIYIGFATITKSYIPFDLPNIGLIIITILTTLAISFSIGFLFSACCVWFRDVKFLVAYVSQLFLFISPVGYTITNIPDDLTWVININPLNNLLTLTRSSMLTEVQSLDIYHQAMQMLSIALVLFLVSSYVFMRMEKKFADVI